MLWDPNRKPCLRPLEAFRPPDGDSRLVGLRDPSNLSDVVLTVSPVALHLMSLMDGTHSCEEMRQVFHSAVGQSLSVDTLQSMIDHLEHAHFLEGPAFESFYGSRLRDYRDGALRVMPHAEALGITDGTGQFFDEMLADGAVPEFTARVVGLIAPHLDYPRGRPCYRTAYATLRKRPVPSRVVILGTNHFGRSPSVVATGNAFVTPLGCTKVDVDFLERLEAGCGDLRRFELDHVFEHSVELQVAWLQHLFGADEFEIVPILCPDPCGPTGTAPVFGDGVDLRHFAAVLGELVAADAGDTLLVAGADLSHVGANFGDDRSLDEGFLAEVRRRDESALAQLVSRAPERWIECVAESGNPTRVCSAGCIFALATALPDASASILGYHQAVDLASQTCVTCTAVAFT